MSTNSQAFTCQIPSLLINLNGDIMLCRPHTNILFLLLYRLRKRGDPSTFTTALGLSTAQHFCVNVVLVDDGGIRRPRPATSRRVSLSAAAPVVASWGNFPLRSTAASSPSRLGLCLARPSPEDLSIIFGSCPCFTSRQSF